MSRHKLRATESAAINDRESYWFNYHGHRGALSKIERPRKNASNRTKRLFFEKVLSVATAKRAFCDEYFSPQPDREIRLRNLRDRYPELKEYFQHTTRFQQ